MHLLQHHSLFSVFWKTVLERLSLGDAPFFTTIEKNHLHINTQSIALSQPPQCVVAFCQQQWTIPVPCESWTDIKKEYVKLLLLRDFLLRENWAPHHLVRLQLLIGEKTIPAQDICLQSGKIVSIRNIEHLLSF